MKPAFVLILATTLILALNARAGTLEAVLEAPFDTRQVGADVALTESHAFVSSQDGGLVFALEAGRWRLQSLLIPSATALGPDTSLTINNRYAFLGFTEQFFGEGQLFVFREQAGIWRETQVIRPQENPPGYGQASAATNTRLLVGAAGVIHAYALDQGQWIETQQLRPSAEARHFGVSLAIDAERAIVGARGDLWSFRLDDGSWTETERIVIDGPPVGPEIDNLYPSLDGRRLLVGRPAEAAPFISSGAAYLFDLNGESWEQVDRLVPTETVKCCDHFGSAVQLSGSTAVVGAPGYGTRPTPPGIGAVFLFNEQIDGSWVEDRRVSFGFREDEFGTSVQKLGDRLLVGASAQFFDGDRSGRACTIDLDGIFGAGFEQGRR